MTVMVFGSNREGRHGAGAAAEALRFYGAKWGVAEGFHGKSYAIVTKELRKGFPPVPLFEIEKQVKKFLLFAAKHPHMTFCVTPIGCGLAGFKPKDIAPFFEDIPKNVLLPEEFKQVLRDKRK